MAPLLPFCLAFALALGSPVARCSAATPAPSVGAVCGATPSCLAWSFSRLFAPIERGVGNQAGMIRFGIIALCSALYIIWWRK
jgi:hypothetical protein